MELLAQIWAWAVAHPAEDAWAAFAALSGAVAVYKANELKIKAAAAKTKTSADDRVIGWLDAVVAVFDVLRLFAPHGLARPRELPPEEPGSDE